MASGTRPISKLFPSQGNATISRRAIFENASLKKIQPAWRPIGNQSDRVRKRA